MKHLCRHRGEAMVHIQLLHNPAPEGTSLSAQRCGCITPGKNRVPIVQETGSGRKKYLASTGICLCSFFLSFSLSFLSIVYLYNFCPHVIYSSTTHNTNIHSPGRIQTRNPSKRSASDPRLRPLGNRKRNSIPEPSSLWRVATPTALFLLDPTPKAALRI